MKDIFLSVLVLFTFYGTAQNLSSGLVAHYKFDRNVNDATSYNNHFSGNVSGFVPFYQNDSAYYFNSNNRLVQSNNFNNSTFTSTSISLWIKPEVGPTTYGGILQGAYAGFTLYVENVTGHVGAFFSANFGTTLLTNINVIDSNWHHVVALNTGSETKIYIDGVLNATRLQNLVTSSGPASQKYVYIGASNLNLNFYKGGLNDLRIYDRVLTQAEITALATFPTATSISKTKKEDITLKVYPNPTNEQITISTKGSLDGSNYTVRNILGQNVAEGFLQSDKETIELTGDKGVYFIEVISKDLTKIVTKVIKK